MKIARFTNRATIIAFVCLLQAVANAGVVISEFRTRGPSGALDEFIELYNNSDSPVDISGWKINASNSAGTTGTRVTINSGTTIPARGHFLATNSTASTGYSGSVGGNQTYTTGFTDDGGVALLMADNTIVDQVGMSAGSAYKEGTPLTPLTTNTDRSYERKPGGAAGSTQDTNDNAADFQVLSPSDPQRLPSIITVTNTNDSGAGSLRQALTGATDGDTITFALALPATITLTSGELVVDKNVTIKGPGANGLTVNGNGSTYRVFHISPGKTVTISGLTITGGKTIGGGGIYNDQGNLTLSNCIVTGNFGVAASAGGIHNAGTLTINNSVISNNTSDDGSSGEYGGARGGGISNGGTLTINSSTISGNQAVSCCNATTGGGVYNTATATIKNSTFANNYAFSGAAIYNAGVGATVEIGNNILSSTPNIFNNSGTVVSSGYNLSSDNGGGFLTATGDQINSDPKLDTNALQNNGGPTQSIALQSISPAINAGDPNAPAQDQRYYLRTGAPDKGAYEYAGTLAPVTAGSRKAHGSAGTFDVALPLTGAAGIECRSGGATNDHQLVLTFATPVTVNGTPQAQVTTGAGQIGTAGSSNGGVVSIVGGVVTVPLTNVSNAQRIVITLFNVSDGINTNNVAIPISMLAGDTTANGTVNSSDIAQTQSQSGQLVTSSNFREDVTVNGTINSSDIAFVQSRSGTALPAAPVSTETTRSKKTRSNRYGTE